MMAVTVESQQKMFREIEKLRFENLNLFLALSPVFDAIDLSVHNDRDIVQVTLGKESVQMIQKTFKKVCRDEWRCD